MSTLFFSFMDESAVSEFTLKQSDAQFLDGELTVVSGVIELVNNHAGMLWNFKNHKVDKYFVPANVMVKYNLKTGDSVVAKTVGDESQKVITDIFSVNGAPVAQLKNRRQHFEEIERILPNQKHCFDAVEFNNLQLLKGENCYLYGENNNENTMTVIDLLNSIECDNKIYINICVAEKTKLLLKKLKNCEMYTCMITANADDAKKMVMLVVERIKRILEVKEDVVAVVDDMLSVAGVDNTSLVLVKSLVSLASATSKHGSVTLVPVMPNESLVQIEKLADARFKIVGKEIIKKF